MNGKDILYYFTVETKPVTHGTMHGHQQHEQHLCILHLVILKCYAYLCLS
jgi:hypothetical protein